MCAGMGGFFTAGGLGGILSDSGGRRLSGEEVESGGSSANPCGLGDDGICNDKFMLPTKGQAVWCARRRVEVHI